MSTSTTRPARGTQRRARRTAALGLAVASLPLAGCALFQADPYAAGGGTAGAGPLKGVSLTVGSKNFTEQLVLCELTAQRLESLGATVHRTCGMNGSNAVRAALVNGDIDMYWEYTGTGWLALKQTEQLRDPQQMWSRLVQLDKANHVVWLPPSQANNTYAVTVSHDNAQKLGVTTLSQYAQLARSHPEQARFCGASEFLGRSDG